MINRIEVEDKINALSKRINNTSDDNIKKELLYDYYSLTELLNSYDNTTHNYPLECDFSFKSIYNSFYKDSLEGIIDNKSDLFDLLCKLDYLRLIRPKKRLKYKEINIESFLNSYNKELLDCYNKLKDNNIEVKNFPGYARGCCFDNYIDKSSYILLKSNSNIILTHELMHAYDFNNISDVNKRICYHYSTFMELLPRLIEYTMINEIDNKYNLVYSYLDGIKCFSEYYLSKINNISGYNSDNELICKDEELNKYNIDLLICDILSIYLYNLYKNDNYRYKLFINDFMNNRGVSDKKIWELIDLNEVSEIIKKEVIEFNKEVKYLKVRR